MLIFNFIIKSIETETVIHICTYKVTSVYCLTLLVIIGCHLYNIETYFVYIAGHRRDY